MSSAAFVPRNNRATIGDCAFAAAAHRAWSDLPPTVTSAQSLQSFRDELKTDLFRNRFSMF